MTAKYCKKNNASLTFDPEKNAKGAGILAKNILSTIAQNFERRAKTSLKQLSTRFWNKNQEPTTQNILIYDPYVEATMPYIL